MKHNKLAILLASALPFFAASCAEEIIQKPLYPTNTGEEFIEVTVDSLAFQGRGGSMNFSVSASYDVTITADEWITMSSLSVPGDAREYVLTATTSANKGDGAADRVGHIYVSTPNLQKEIVVIQPFYNRPDIANPIKTAEEFKFFIEEGAPYIESGEVISLGSDIDMKGITLATAAEYFAGVLDGNGYTIKNMSGDKPLFAKLNDGASITNLKIDGEYVISNVTADYYFSPFAGIIYGTISNCENDANITVNGECSAKVYVGGIAAYAYNGAKIEGCINRGAVKFIPASSTANIYYGGICAYCYCDIAKCENYGPFTGEPAAFTGIYYIGGITSRLEKGTVTGCTVHKEAKIYTGQASGSGKSYIGGIIGHMFGAPATGYNSLFADIEINVKAESYIGGLQGFQAGVDDANTPNATLFEGSIVNSNITAYTKGTGKNGNNPCNSAGFVTGRFSGQKGKKTNLHYGTAEEPIRISGSINCLATNTKAIATAKDYQALLDGDGSVTSVNNGAITETDYNTIAYEVVGDGQTGPSEDLIVRSGSVKLSVPYDGGVASFSARGNYTMTVKSESDWLEVSTGVTDKKTGDVIFAKELTIEGDNTFYDIIIRGVANDHTYAREGSVVISMPMGSTEVITVAQAGNLTLPATLEVDAASLVLDPAGQAASKVNVTANYDAVVTSDADWVSFSPATVTGDEKTHVLSITGAKNKSGASRTATVTITNKDKVKTISLSQDKFVVPAYSEVKNAEQFVEFIENAFDAELYPAGKVTKLTADIDLKGVSFTAPASYAGVLDGNGKSIKNMAASGALFATLTGEVKNLTIDKTCTIAPSANMAWIATINSGKIVGCVNNADITATTDLGASARLAGFVATNNGTISECTNNGKITFKGETDPRAMYLAGIAGSGGNGARIDKCRNNGAIYFESPANSAQQYKRCAGIVGLIESDDAQVTNCVNSKTGTITLKITTPTSVKNVRVGGIMGELKKKVVMTGCKSFGDISCDLDNSAVNIGGLVGYLNTISTAITFFEGCAVNCKITAATAATSTTSANPLEVCGLVFGTGVASAKAVHTLGTADSPIKVAGSVVCGETVYTAAADTFHNILNGNKCGNNLTNGFANVVYNAKFEEVTKE